MTTQKPPPRPPRIPLPPTVRVGSRWWTKDMPSTRRSTSPEDGLWRYEVIKVRTDRKGAQVAVLARVSPTGRIQRGEARIEPLSIFLAADNPDPRTPYRALWWGCGEAFHPESST